MNVSLIALGAILFVFGHFVKNKFSMALKVSGLIVAILGVF